MVEDVSIDSNKAASLAIVDDDDDMILNCILNVGLQETDFCLLHSIVTDFQLKSSILKQFRRCFHSSVKNI